MIFRQLFDYETWTYTYLLADQKTREALLIDSVYEQHNRDLGLLRDLGLNPKYLLETHVHADHITGVTAMKQAFPDAQSVVSKYAGAICADIKVDQGDVIQIGEMALQVLATPGHTDACVSYVLKGMVFTGDALLIRGCGRTDFQQGDSGKLYDSLQKLLALPADTLVYPAHNYVGMTVSTIEEEAAFNPRLAGKSREEFMDFMDHLNLPNPRKIMEAVPANLHCGNLAKIAIEEEK